MEGERGNSKRLLGGAQSLGNRTKLGEDELLGDLEGLDDWLTQSLVVLSYQLKHNCRWSSATPIPMYVCNTYHSPPHHLRLLLPSKNPAASQV